MSSLPQQATSPRSYNFVKAINFTLPWEAGKNKDGSLRDDVIVDSGGKTKYGISQKENPGLDIDNLTLADAITTYKTLYWDCYLSKDYGGTYIIPDSLEVGVGVALFDTGVNQGVNVAFSSLVQATKSGQEAAAFIIQQRINRYYDLAKDAKYKSYLNGWIARVNDLKKYISVLRQEPSGFSV